MKIELSNTKIVAYGTAVAIAAGAAVYSLAARTNEVDSLNQIIVKYNQQQIDDQAAHQIQMSQLRKKIIGLENKTEKPLTGAGKCEQIVINLAGGQSTEHVDDSSVEETVQEYVIMAGLEAGEKLVRELGCNTKNYDIFGVANIYVDKNIKGCSLNVIGERYDSKINEVRVSPSIARAFVKAHRRM